MARTRVVLLHGVGLDHTMWGRVRELLPDSYDVSTPDLLGHGSRPAAPDGVTLRDLADDVASRLEPGTHLVGFSLGALVAQHLARFQPHLVASLTSVSSVCRRTDEERTAVERRLIAAGEDFSGSVAAALERWFAGTDVDPVTVKEVEATLAANDVSSYVRCYRVFAHGDAELAAELSRIAVPSLAVTGELDPGSTPDMTRRLAAEIPGCRAVIVPGARHLLPVQAPASLTDPLVTFIGGLS
jgi:pimeloyl-ACP methyl ester carboxylesterase